MNTVRKAARAKIAAAADVTAAIGKAMCDARADLEEAWANGHGVLSDPHITRSRLMRARKRLDEAMAALDAARWPSGADYDAAE